PAAACASGLDGSGVCAGADAHRSKRSVGALVTRKVPSPLEKATGSVYHHGVWGPRTRAMSVRPSPSKSPVCAPTPGTEAQPAKSTEDALATRNVPSPLENATGTEPQ